METVDLLKKELKNLTEVKKQMLHKFTADVLRSQEKQEPVSALPELVSESR